MTKAWNCCACGHVEEVRDPALDERAGRAVRVGHDDVVDASRRQSRRRAGSAWWSSTNVDVRRRRRRRPSRSRPAAKSVPVSVTAVPPAGGPDVGVDREHDALRELRRVAVRVRRRRGRRAGPASIATGERDVEGGVARAVGRDRRASRGTSRPRGTPAGRSSTAGSRRSRGRSVVEGALSRTAVDVGARRAGRPTVMIGKFCRSFGPVVGVAGVVRRRRRRPVRSMPRPRCRGSSCRGSVTCCAVLTGCPAGDVQDPALNAITLPSPGPVPPIDDAAAVRREMPVGDVAEGERARGVGADRSCPGRRVAGRVADVERRSVVAGDDVARAGAGAADRAVRRLDDDAAAGCRAACVPVTSVPMKLPWIDVPVRAPLSSDAVAERCRR